MSPTPFATRLNDSIERTGSIACVGLDPRFRSLPAAIRDSVADDRAGHAAAYETFCREIIDVVADRVACVKPQVAFFEAEGPPGMVSLAKVIAHARVNGVPVITDAKRGDIGSTAIAYAEAHLDPSGGFGSDSLTVNPYLGEDSLVPFVDVCDQFGGGIFVLVKTSNPGGSDFQDLAADGRPVYRHVASRVASLNAGRMDARGYGPVGAVVGATYPDQLAELREAMPHSILLVPGFGAQGGRAEDVLIARDKNGLGAVVNSSRAIIFAHSQDRHRDRDWTDAVSVAVDEMNAALS